MTTNSYLRFEPISRGNGVVGGPEVAGSHDEVNVLVAVIVLLKLQRSDAQLLGAEVGRAFDFSK